MTIQEKQSKKQLKKHTQLYNKNTVTDLIDDKKKF